MMDWLPYGGDLSVPPAFSCLPVSGIFPWYDEGLPILWWSPGSRAIFDLATFTSPKRLARTARQRGFETRFDTSFAAVMRGCAERDEGTWITRDILQGYQHLHRAGFASLSRNLARRRIGRRRLWGVDRGVVCRGVDVHSRQ
jgi:leucyl/phenylalanyl-tRNA--protein transferase